MEKINIQVIGSAGTGKSHIIALIQDVLKDKGITVEHVPVDHDSIQEFNSDIHQEAYPSIAKKTKVSISEVPTNKLTKSKHYIDSSDLDDLVKDVYGLPYCFQQQDGCKDRGIEYYSIGDKPYGNYPKEIDIKVNGNERGVDFETWKTSKPEDFFSDEFSQKLFYYRNYYPDVQLILNDLHERGHLNSGELIIEIDW